MKDPVTRQIVSENDEWKHTELKKRSHFYPRHLISKEITTFETMVLDEMEKIQPKKSHNLTKEEKEALKELADDKTIVIKPADKGGGGIVIQNREDYHEESSRILNDIGVYQRIPHNPLEGIKKKFDDFIRKGEEREFLNDKETDYLTVKHPRIPVFYHLPKIHKNMERPPGRPIVSGINSVSSKIAEYLDHLLQPIVKRIPSYLKDTGDIIRSLESVVWEEKFFLVTCDVRSLYTNIPHNRGCEATRTMLLEDGEIKKDQIDYIVEGITLILENNFFWYDDQYFLQLMGTAMGSKIAPSYANLFMALWEKTWIKDQHEWDKNILIYKRYIDDIIFIWKGSEEDLVCFLEFLNQNDWGIRLDSHFSQSDISFLDLEIYIEDLRIKTRTHFKNVDVNSYIE
uniref:Reverse transcriptase domain-containing protein n=1 Tax=Leptobrachium leishanense TaxID=445787 RepID=A0A8C5M7U7_9ANUR